MTTRSIISTDTTNIYFIDLFCGAGGVTTGVMKARTTKGKRAAKVIACVNHDPLAIESHAANHPGVVHFMEDIRTLDLTKMIKLVKSIRRNNTKAQIHLWASLECINFSKAKGGLPRDADSRTLACDLFRYIEGLKPDHVWIENVEEFMAWGPLDENGKPVSKRNGRDYLRWVKTMCSYGFKYDWRILNCADFGDYTSRKRFFCQFYKQENVVKWPKPTHSRNPIKNGLFQGLKPWKPVRDVLDLSDFGVSIFERRKPLVDNTLRRILAGLNKFAKSDDQFLIQHYSGKADSRSRELSKPSPTLTTVPHESILTTKREFLVKYHGNSSVLSTDLPSSSLTTRDRLGLVQFLPMQYGKGGNVASVEQPAWSVTTNPKHMLATAIPNRHFLVNPQYSSKGRSIDHPCFTLIARMDKMPPYLASCHSGEPRHTIQEGDSEVMKEIKLFMAKHGISDIFMRMLKIPELKRITGFPDDYILKGSKTHQKKQIGNAVPTKTVKAMIEAYM